MSHFSAHLADGKLGVTVESVGAERHINNLVTQCLFFFARVVYTVESVALRLSANHNTRLSHLSTMAAPKTLPQRLMHASPNATSREPC